MASVLLDLGLYGHDSLLASLGCPQPGPDLLSSGFLGSLRPVTSKKCPFHLAFLCQLRKLITHFPSSGEAWTCRSEPRRWGLEHLTWEKRLRKLGLPVWKRESSGGSYSHVCINIWWDGMKKSKPIFPVLYGDNLRGSGHKAKKLNSFWTHSSPTFFYSEYDQTLAQIKRFSLRMMKHRLPKVFLGHIWATSCCYTSRRLEQVTFSGLFQSQPSCLSVKISLYMYHEWKCASTKHCNLPRFNTKP